MVALTLPLLEEVAENDGRIYVSDILISNYRGKCW